MKQTEKAAKQTTKQAGKQLAKQGAKQAVKNNPVGKYAEIGIVGVGAAIGAGYIWSKYGGDFGEYYKDIVGGYIQDEYIDPYKGLLENDNPNGCELP